MHKISAAAIAALLTAASGLAAAVPAFAGEHRSSMERQIGGHPDRHGGGGRNHEGRRGGNMGNFLSFERGGEALEIALVRLSYRLDLTQAQQPLFDELRTAALAAATTYADAVADARIQSSDCNASENLTDVHKQHIAIETAHLTGLTSVEPALTASLASLTPEQQASLQPARGQRGREV